MKVNAKTKMTAARLRFLSDASRPQGVYAVEFYKPVQWAMENKYVEYRGHYYFITELGRKALEEAEK